MKRSKKCPDDPRGLEGALPSMGGVPRAVRDAVFGGKDGGALRGGSSGRSEFLKISINLDKFTGFFDKFTEFPLFLINNEISNRYNAHPLTNDILFNT
ncbi:MAG: hypothetical protein OXL41_13400 [Nitrospinae bacterium]|nr:hypothetical protein [Nitrospinota bacterium]